MLDHAVIEFTVPYPKSRNHSTYASGRLRPGVMEWRRSAGWAYKAAGGKLLDGSVAIELDLYKPLNRTKVAHDVDNAPFNVLNALKGVAYDDDDQVDLLVVAKFWPDGQGRVVVRVKKIGRREPPV